MSPITNIPRNWNAVIGSLRESGALAADAVPPDESQTMPVAVMILQTIAAWIAAALLIAAIVVSVFSSRSENAWVACGMVLIAGATAVMRLNRQSFFLPQMAVPVAIAGAVLIGVGIKPEAWQMPTFALALILFCISGHQLLRFIAAGTLLWVLWYWLTPWVGRHWWLDGDEPAPWLIQLSVFRNLLFSLALWWLWTRPQNLLGRLGPAVFQPLRHALLWFWLGVQLWQTSRLMGDFGASISHADWFEPTVGWFAYRLIDLLPLVGAVFDTLRRNPGLGARVWPLVVLLPVCVVSPVLATAALVLWIGLSEGRGYLTGLGIATALAGFGMFYYSLTWPLLYKGLLLMGSGGVLLLVWWGMHHEMHRRAAA
ncbi:DUF4401 domain-containing protein [Andreprevotia chitinilytica]|uniref:DUF4401 domain-containing protein n=1 Tax=Andreprevotia chitinilytica TaxID=396808 RepID=UPI000558F503|nr:DUF4401 domain-containing protein [Andreprevotia chitinilytica]